MAKQTWESENLDGFIAAIYRMAKRVGTLNDLGQVDHPSALPQIAKIVGEAFHRTAQQQSPYYTGTLHDAHVISDLEVTNRGGKTQAQIRIYIDPDPTLINPVFGGFPGQYGPEYHRDRRQWFAEARELIDPLFGKVMDTQVQVFFEDFW
jgi:hypothetical protein